MQPVALGEHQIGRPCHKAGGQRQRDCPEGSIDFEVHRFIKSFHFRGSDFDPCGLLIICAGGYSIPVRPNNWMDVSVKLHMEPGKKNVG